MAKVEKRIEIVRIKKQVISVPVEAMDGSLLLVHKFSDLSIKEMLDKHMGKAKTAKAPKDPIQDLVLGLHILYENKDTRSNLVEKMHEGGAVPGSDITKYFKGTTLGFPASGFKGAAVAVCRNVDGMDMVRARGAFFIYGEDSDLVKLKYKKIMFQQDRVVLNGKVPDIRHRAAIVGWTAKLKVLVNPSVLSAEQVVNLLHNCGLAVGIGDWRPTSRSSSGSFGMFEVTA